MKPMNDTKSAWFRDVWDVVSLAVFLAGLMGILVTFL